MKKIILATGNEGKVRELNAMLKGHYKVISQNDMQVKEVPETGTTFIENALNELNINYNIITIFS